MSRTCLFQWDYMLLFTDHARRLQRLGASRRPDDASKGIGNAEVQKLILIVFTAVAFDVDQWSTTPGVGVDDERKQHSGKPWLR